jgi:hypothetical protein
VRFGLKGSGSTVWGVGFGIQGFRLKAYCFLGFGDRGLGFGSLRFGGLRFGGLRFEVSGVGLGVPAFRF